MSITNKCAVGRARPSLDSLSSASSTEKLPMKSALLFVAGFMVLLGFTTFVGMNQCLAAKGGRAMGFASESQGSSSAPPSSMSAQNMIADLSLHYVRDTTTNGGTDTAARFSVGGMFNSWLGLDGVGLFQIKSQSFLIGADVRVLPVDWFFFKGGAGGYSHKQTREFRFTPLAGSGILARLNQEFYFLTEVSYFQVNDQNNLSFGVGLGIIF